MGGIPQWEAFLKVGAEFGFHPRRPDVLAFARRRRVLLVRHETSGLSADLVVAALPFEQEVIRQARTKVLGDIHVAVPSAENLIIMKAVASRPRDLADIEAVLDANPRVNLARVRGWVRKFSAALEAPEILDELERVLVARRRRKKAGPARRGV